jgi:hypothetical protein
MNEVRVSSYPPEIGFTVDTPLADSAMFPVLGIADHLIGTGQYQTEQYGTGILDTDRYAIAGTAPIRIRTLGRRLNPAISTPLLSFLRGFSRSLISL